MNMMALEHRCHYRSNKLHLRRFIPYFDINRSKSLILFWISGVKSVILSIEVPFVILLSYNNLRAYQIYEIEPLFHSIISSYVLIISHFTFIH